MPTSAPHRRSPTTSAWVPAAPTWAARADGGRHLHGRRPLRRHAQLCRGRQRPDELYHRAAGNHGDGQPETKVYGTADPTLTYQITRARSKAATPSRQPDPLPGENVGSYAIGQGLSRQQLRSDLRRRRSVITPATLIVTAGNLDINHGDAIPTPTTTSAASSAATRKRPQRRRASRPLPTPIMRPESTRSRSARARSPRPTMCSSSLPAA